MSRADAIKAVKQHLQRFCIGDATVKLYLWHDPVGVRVAEVSFANESGGASWMQSDPAGLAVCAAVERAIIAYMEDEDIELQLDILNSYFPKD